MVKIAKFRIWLNKDNPGVELAKGLKEFILESFKEFKLWLNEKNDLGYTHKETILAPFEIILVIFVLISLFGILIFGIFQLFSK